jgi:RNA polymerase sigma factor (TIGR02999 family)
MPTTAATSIADLLKRWQQGDPAALEALLPMVYADLRRMASAQLRRFDGHATLQPTALVHDVLVRLLEHPTMAFESDAHLFNTFAKIMRQLLTNRARSAATIKRGGDRQRDELLDMLELPIPSSFDLIELDQALRQLEAVDARMAAVVELRCFIGLEVAEVAELLQVAERTVLRDWLSALAWLRARLGD